MERVGKRGGKEGWEGELEDGKNKWRGIGKGR